MINGFDSYKLSINNLNDINADTIISNTDKTTSLYINNQLIDFSSYVTSSYLSTTLSNYVLTSTFNSTLSNYVTYSSLSSTLSNYATYGALSSYRLISDSWSRGDTTNEIVIRVGNCGTNSDGSIKTAKTYTDESIAGVYGAVGVNTTAIAGLVAWQSATDATIGVIEGEIGGIEGQIATLDADVGTLQTDVGNLQTDVSTLETKTQNQTATAGTTNFAGQVNINNLTTIASNGSITCDSVNCSTGVISQLTTNVSYEQYIYSNTSVNIGNTAPYTGISSIYLNGLVYVNGTLLVPFSSASSFFSQW